MRGAIRTVLFIVSIFVILLVFSPFELAFVETDSMDPSIQPEHDIFIIDKSQTDVDKISEGEVITFYSETRNSLTTHRVIDRTPDGLITQGDNSFQTDQERGDPPVNNEVIEGKALDFQGDVFTIGYLAPVAQLMTEFRFEIVLLLLSLLIIDSFLPSNKNRNRRMEITPFKVILFVSLILVLLWTGFIFISSSTVAGPNLVVQENADPNNERFVELGEKETRTQIFEIQSPSILPIHTEYESISEGAEIVNIEESEDGSTEFTYDVGPYNEESVQDIQFVVYTYPQTLRSNHISYLHNINPIVASLATVSVLVIPFLVFVLLFFNNYRIRFSRSRWYKKLKRYD